MKSLTLIGAVIVTVVILIISFQNIGTTASYYFFFQADQASLTMPMFFISVLGIITGSLYTVFIQQVMKDQSAEKEEDEANEKSDF